MDYASMRQAFGSSTRLVSKARSQHNEGTDTVVSCYSATSEKGAVFSPYIRPDGRCREVRLLRSSRQ
jgi:hypothetical protein